MFGNWSAIPVSGTAEGLTQIQKYSGPLTFPRYTTKPSSAQTPLRVPANADSRSIYAYFAAIKRATDVTQEHLDVLNVSVEYDVDVEQLLDGTDAWFPVDSDEVWSERKRELEIENTVANEVMGRIRRDVKLGHMYKFFQSVEMVAPYYGTPEEVVAEAAKKAAEDLNPKSKETVLTIGSPSPANDVDKMEIDSTEPESNGNGKRPASEPALGTAKRDRATPETDPIAPLDGEAILKTKKKEKFSMPERFRDDLVKNFVEPICWGHGVRVYPPRAAPKLNFQYSKFSVHLNYHIHLTPTSSTEARAGIVDGPVLGMQIRSEHAFRALVDPISALRKRRKNLMAAAMASKRPPTAEEEAARQKKEERDRARAERHAKRRVGRPTPEEDKDKEEKPIVGEMTEEVALEEELGDEGILVQGAEGPQDVVGVAREIAALLSIAQLRNREGETERKVRFRAVGREEGSYWDDVYMVTSIHHHVSISQLKVSKPYLRFLRTGKYPKADHEFIKQGGWDKLELKKTKYLSLMVPEERVQAARALVTVLRWETRLEKELAR